jgi:1-acyl-sn-glycerol-3-phosphate acyltransferase
VLRNYSKRNAKEYIWWRSLLHYVSIYMILVPYFKIFYNAKVEGTENIPQNQSFIVAANHLSDLDPVIISMAVKKPIAFMAKKQLFESPKLRKIIDIYGAFAVNREKLEVSTIKTAKAVISTKKWVLAMFPQSSRDIPGIITRVTPGFAYLAKMTGAKILPVAIVGSEIHNPKIFEGNLIVKIGKPIDASPNLDEVMKKWVSVVTDLTGFKDKTPEIK